MNAITAISPEKAAIPIYFDTDQRCLDVCAKTTGVAAFEELRIVRIKNTASLKYLQVSRTLEKEVLSNRNLKLITPWQKIRFDKFNNLPEFKPEF